MNKQTKAILETSSQELIKKLQAIGESITTICEATGMSRSQVSLVGNGHRELGEHYFRELVKMAITKKVLP